MSTTTTTPKVFPLYITTDANGNGSVQFQCTKSGVMFNVVKVTMQMTPTSSGVATLTRNGGVFLSAMPVAPKMEAIGNEILNYSEYLTITVVAGPVSTQLSLWVQYHEEEPQNTSSAGLQWTQQLGTAGPIDNPVLIFTIANANSFINTGIIDIRAYRSYSITLDAINGTFTNTDVVGLQVTFYADPAGTVAIQQDNYQLFKTNIAGSGQFCQIDTCHGAYMKIFVFDQNSVGRTFFANLVIYGSFRETFAIYSRSATEFIVLESRLVLAAAAAQTVIARFAYGRARLRCRSGAGGGCTVLVEYGGPGAVLAERLTIGAANTEGISEFIMPRRQASVTITNTGAAGSTIDTQIIREAPSY